MKLAKEIVDEFFEIPIGITEDLVQDLADGMEHLFKEYTAFVASCGKSHSLTLGTLHLSIVINKHILMKIMRNMVMVST